ncbi:DUF1801 domain-containing protein [Salinicoccus sp. ID82-1]|uniref:DUF1801 domain-containing protein n=1 Tax=Salinicoccus sp. ID82-1 TaxID=2820269 RepID=UPI001F2680A1|nr:DUF1801 domain-containing protein [Salinicoccus sp. ID82-1]MCG1010285.1 DUF1801 domain-containing protein [Salinicoccus sp. ID82-1]
MNIEEYIENIDDRWKTAFSNTWKTIGGNIPEGFEAEMQHGMPTYTVPKETYPKGYHVDGEALPFIGVAAQKRHLAIYHMGIYRDEQLHGWLIEEYPKHMKTKLDMGKSCIRFSNLDKVPYDLIGELAGKMTVEQWVGLYESKKP